MGRQPRKQHHRLPLHDTSQGDGEVEVLVEEGIQVEHRHGAGRRWPQPPGSRLPGPRLSTPGVMASPADGAAP